MKTVIFYFIYYFKWIVIYYQSKCIFLSLNIDSIAKCPSPLALMNPDKLIKVLSDLVALPFSSTLIYLFVLKILRK